MKNFDAIIIGCGIHGASLAFHLAQRGVKVIVLERRHLAAGATGRSSGLVRMHYDLEPEARLAWESFRYFQNWEQIVGGEAGFTRTGYLHIAQPEYSAQLRANVAMHQGIGIPSILVTAADVRRLAPEFYTGDFEIAAYEPESGYADPNGATAGFMGAAKQFGAEFVFNCSVTDVFETGSVVKGVQSTAGTFPAPVVVNAAGSWAAEVGAMAGLELPVDTWRHDTMYVRRPAELGASHPTVIDDINEMYFRPESGSLTLVGLEDGNPHGLSPDHNPDTAMAGFVDRAAERICRRIPVMETASLHSAHGGYDGITPDQRAILGPAGPEGFYLVCGFSGTGFKIGPAVGACMAELILEGQATTVDISPFGIERFEKGAMLKGDHAYNRMWSSDPRKGL
jgi:sarcosine oxidase subunit beta